MKTSELSDAALDWAVAKCENRKINSLQDSVYGVYSPCTNWAQGGLIIERERITICPNSDSTWWAVHPRTELEMHGATALQAAMRCYVAYKLGDEVDVPDELSAT